MKVWVLLPAFNEAENLPALLQGVSETLEGAGIAFSVVVVDDGSVDGTRAAAQRYQGRLPVHILAHAQNRGLAQALRTGIDYVLREARPEDVMVTMDADNTHPPQLIPSMVDSIREGTDIVVASRYVPGAVESGVPAYRRMLSRGVRLLMRVRFGLESVHDYSSGYRAYRVDVLKEAAQRYGPGLVSATGFAATPELLVKLGRLAPRIVEIPLRLNYSLKRGRSKLRLLRTIGEYLRLLVRPV